MAYTKLIPQHTRGARVDEISRVSSHYLLYLPAGKTDQYRLAQLDDYGRMPRKHFPHRAPVQLGLSARVSTNSHPGTWGFGFWNLPFGMSLGFGGAGFRLPTLPNAAWFFGASQENYLSFKESGKAAANGFIVQSFRSPSFHPLLIPAGLVFPFSHKRTRRLLSQVIDEAGKQLWSPMADQKVDPTDWHRYQLNWQEEQISFVVDDTVILESPASPRTPQGLVIWIDNQFAAFTPEGKIGFGVLENPEPAWLEVKEIEII